MKKIIGLSFIELFGVVAIVSLTFFMILPRYIGFTDDTLKSKIINNAATFRTSVKFAHMKWLVLGSPSNFEKRNNIQLYGVGLSGQVDFNEFGYPSKHSNEINYSLSVENEQDCQSLWHVLVDHGDDDIGIENRKKFSVSYEGNQVCAYRLTHAPEYGFIYQSTTGKVIII